jgi:hypothetical protein
MPLKQLKHTQLKFMNEPVVPKTSANDLVGVKATGKIDTDSSFKISGGSVMNTSRNNVNPRIRNKNKETLDSLVRTAF